ncbi:MAG: hypothetical protein WCG07_00815 [Candidatus Taylorbacteria bacterium]
MKNKALILFAAITIIAIGFTNHAEARARYGSARIGGYTSHGKASHYSGGYVRSTHTYKYYLKH